MIQTSELLSFAVKIAKEAGEIQMSYFGNICSLEKKSTNIDLVTNADIESEKYLINAIQKEFPEHSIQSEENGKISNDNEYTWVIDPLDGTTNFAHKLPIFSVSIGIIKNDKTECGVVFNPAANKCFYAVRNCGAFLDNQPIHVSSSSTLSDSLLATGFPYLHDSSYDRSFALFKEFYDKTRGIRRLGAASLDLCFVAMGRFDGYYEYGLKPWDICAGSLILLESGGNVTDWNNKKIPFSGKRILATNKLIHNEMISILTKKEYSIFF